MQLLSSYFIYYKVYWSIEVIKSVTSYLKQKPGNISVYALSFKKASLKVN